MRTIIFMVLAATALAGTPPERTVNGRGVSFKVPHGATKGRFTALDDGRHRFEVKTNVGGLDTLAVTVGPRGDPECTLKNELIGAEATARLPAFRRSGAHVIKLNRSKGCESLEARGAVKVAHAIGWSARRQFELELVTSRAGVDPRAHIVWKRLVESFQSEEAPLR